VLLIDDFDDGFFVLVVGSLGDAENALDQVGGDGVALGELTPEDIEVGRNDGPSVHREHCESVAVPALEGGFVHHRGGLDSIEEFLKPEDVVDEAFAVLPSNLEVAPEILEAPVLVDGPADAHTRRIQCEYTGPIPHGAPRGLRGGSALLLELYFTDVGFGAAGQPYAATAR
jgi:hypothetical protein